MMAPRQLLLIVLAFLAISEISTSSSSSNSNRWRKCRNLPTLFNGQIIRNGLNTIDYECNPGYKLAVTATCQRGRSWTPSVTCEEKVCDGEPVIAANSSLDGEITSRSVGAIYNFTCDPGFKGMGKVVCDESGKWNVDEVQCTETLCDGEPVAANSSIVGNVTSRQPGAEYDFTCDPGFEFGTAKVVCDESGIWNVDEVQCIECIALKNTVIGLLITTSTSVEVADEQACIDLCANDPTCSTLPVNYDVEFPPPRCNKFPLPFISTTSQPSLEDCIAACNANDECIVLTYVPGTDACYLANTDDIGVLGTYSFSGATMVEKNCRL